MKKTVDHIGRLDGDAKYTFHNSTQYSPVVAPLLLNMYANISTAFLARRALALTLT